MSRPIVAALVGLLAAVAGLASGGQPSADPAGPLRKLTVDAAAPEGMLRSLSGVNGAPAPGMHKPETFLFGGWNMPEHVDASVGYRLARIDLVRTHDAYGPGDIDATFATSAAPGGTLISPQRDVFSLFPRADADPDDPASYRFGPTDKLVGSIVQLGAQAIFRLGRSEGADPKPPADFDRYARIVKHIVLHYNRGWANGFHYRIRYWEIWNEPDLGKVFWSGTPQQYFELYAKLARAVKDADPEALVGGPAIARPNDDTPYGDAFLEYVRTAHVPLDFYSWHWYATDSNDPLDFNRVAAGVRRRLDRHGFTATQSLLTEWNYGLESQAPPSAVRASFVTSALIYMQDAPINAATLYRADSLFGADGATPDPTGQALIAVGRMKDTPVRLQSGGSDRQGLAVVAGRARNGDLLQVLVSNYQVPARYLGPRAGDNVLHVPQVFDVALLERRSLSYADNSGYDLTVEHLTPGQRYVVEQCLISAGSRFTTSVMTASEQGNLRIRATMPPPGVALLSVRPANAATGSSHGSEENVCGQRLRSATP
jgi:hypothetical protein